MAVLTPALLWKRANPVNCEYRVSKQQLLRKYSWDQSVILGGAGLGGGIGVLTHYTRSLTGDIPPRIELKAREPPEPKA